jgi:hypothetical protein
MFQRDMLGHGAPDRFEEGSIGRVKLGEKATRLMGLLIILGSRSRLRILLTEEEINRLDPAVAESYAVTRNLLVCSAIHEGLKTFKPETIQKPSRHREVRIWVPKDMKNKIRELAETNSITQQTILRHLLFQYITRAPWNNTENQA